MNKPKKKRKRIWLAILIAFFIVSAGGYLGYLLFGQQMIQNHLRGLPGNAAQYEPENIESDPDSPLRGKTIIFLGSSVTRGYGACDTSFVELLVQKDGVIAVKEAVGGTTLVTRNDESYIPRMEKIEPTIRADAFVCQLSTNDARGKLPLGTVSDSFDRSAFDTATVAGALEYIVSYAQETWNCPVVFYTGTRYDSGHYGKMVALLHEIEAKWGCTVVDLWNDDALNNISEEQRKLYMLDDIHPTKAGYWEWWLEPIEAGLINAIEN